MNIKRMVALGSAALLAGFGTYQVKVEKPAQRAWVASVPARIEEMTNYIQNSNLLKAEEIRDDLYAEINENSDSNTRNLISFISFAELDALKKKVKSSYSAAYNDWVAEHGPKANSQYQPVAKN